LVLEVAFAAADLDWREHVEIDPKLIRPAEVDYLCRDASNALTKLGWAPEASFEELINMMVTADIELVQRANHGISLSPITQTIPAEGSRLMRM
jgi:GDPmannose 4,6-dehydratase